MEGNLFLWMDVFWKNYQFTKACLFAVATLSLHCLGCANPTPEVQKRKRNITTRAEGEYFSFAKLIKKIAYLEY